MDLDKHIRAIKDAQIKHIGNQVTDHFAKGKAANEGEEREWGGKKYKKTGGKWVPVTGDKKAKKEDEPKSKSPKKDDEGGSSKPAEKKEGGDPGIDKHEIAQLTAMKTMIESNPDKAYEIFQSLSPEAQHKVPQDVVNQMVQNSHKDPEDVDFDSLGEEGGEGAKTDQKAGYEKEREEWRQYFEEYFEDEELKLSDKFSIKDFAESTGLPEEHAITGLFNLDNPDLMKEIAEGEYDNFDLYESNDFNDAYGDMMEDIEGEEEVSLDSAEEVESAHSALLREAAEEIHGEDYDNKVLWEDDEVLELANDKFEDKYGGTYDDMMEQFEGDEQNREMIGDVSQQIMEQFEERFGQIEDTDKRAEFEEAVEELLGDWEDPEEASLDDFADLIEELGLETGLDDGEFEDGEWDEDDFNEEGGDVDKAVDLIREVEREYGVSIEGDFEDRLVDMIIASFEDTDLSQLSVDDLKDILDSIGIEKKKGGDDVKKALDNDFKILGL